MINFLSTIMYQNKYNKKKQIIILRHNGGQLGNQLLLFISVYAYCLEKGFTCKNFSFYEYSKYFNFQSSNMFVNFFEKINTFQFYKKHAILYIAYKYFSYFFQIIKKGKIIKEDSNATIFLPPTITKDENHKNLILGLENSNEAIIYIDGWGFRNPTGLKKYYKQIVINFSPKKQIMEKVNKFLHQVKNNYFVIGVHIRQGDYKISLPQWYFNEKQVSNILKHFLKREKMDPKKVLFIICSDEKLDISNFQGLNVKIGPGSMIEDLMTLSRCNIIIGSNSTFGSFSAYFGNIPFYIFDRKIGYVRARGTNLFQN